MYEGKTSKTDFYNFYHNLIIKILFFIIKLSGDLLKEEELLSWLIHQKRHSEIPEVTNKMVDKLIDTVPYLAVLFCKFFALNLSPEKSNFHILNSTKNLFCHFTDDKDDKQDIRILNELENIDDDLEKEDIVIVRIDNDAEAKEYGIDHLPTLIYFENKIPALYEGILKCIWSNLDILKNQR